MTSLTTQDKKREYTPQQTAFRHALMGEAKGNLRVAKDLAGYAPSVTVAEIVRSLRDELREDALDVLSMHASRAAYEVVDLIDNPMKNGATTSLKAAESVLSRVGVQAKEDVNINVPSGGLFIMPAKNRREELASRPTFEIDHEEIIDA